MIPISILKQQDNLWVKTLKVTGTTVSEVGLVGTYETQAFLPTSTTIGGLAKTSGIGGTESTHNQMIDVYVPNI